MCCCGGCGQYGCLGCYGVFRKKAFEGQPYDMRTYYADDMAKHLLLVKKEFADGLAAGGVRSIQVSEWKIKMENLFSEKRDYLLVKYAGVNTYVLFMPFGQDLYASWISFFKLGCLQRLARAGIVTPTDYDIDDLDLIGSDIDVCLRAALDAVMRRVGSPSGDITRVLAGAK
ncbi:MAG: hypothetical protein JSW59_08035, partial [Phycisphaerales bacterium]